MSSPEYSALSTSMLNEVDVSFWSFALIIDMLQRKTPSTSSIQQVRGAVTVPSSFIVALKAFDCPSALSALMVAVDVLETVSLAPSLHTVIFKKRELSSFCFATTSA